MNEYLRKHYKEAHDKVVTAEELRRGAGKKTTAEMRQAKEGLKS